LAETFISSHVRATLLLATNSRLDERGTPSGVPEATPISFGAGIAAGNFDGYGFSTPGERICGLRERGSAACWGSTVRRNQT
jgi:hypothetical protein